MNIVDEVLLKLGSGHAPDEAGISRQSTAASPRKLGLLAMALCGAAMGIYFFLPGTHPAKKSTSEPPRETRADEIPQPAKKNLAPAAPFARNTARERMPVAIETPLAETRFADPPPMQEAAIATETAALANGWETRSVAVREQLEAGDYAEADKNAQTLTKDFAQRWEPWFWLGTAQLAQGQMVAAEAALEQAGKLNSRVAQIWVQRAVVAQERGDHMLAVKLLNEARELAPKSPHIHLNLGYSNDALGLTQEADQSYHRFLSLTEGDGAYTLQRKPVMERLNVRN